MKIVMLAFIALSELKYFATKDLVQSIKSH